MAAGEVNSNIVGYVTKGLVKNQKLQSGAQFVEVGTNELDIASIVLEGVPVGSTVSIMWWDGADYGEARWSNRADFPVNTHTGWVNPGGYVGAKKTFAPGEGFWIVAPDDDAVTVDAKVTQAGEVALSSEITYDFAVVANKKYMVINPLATDIDISDIELMDVPVGSTVSIMWWNGTNYGEARWSNRADFPVNTHTGWVNPGGYVGATKTFAPGDGFWIVLPDDEGVLSGAKIKIANQVQVL